VVEEEVFEIVLLEQEELEDQVEVVQDHLEIVQHLAQQAQPTQAAAVEVVQAHQVHLQVLADQE
jgi:predicted site-specific integrase-resolvase